MPRYIVGSSDGSRRRNRPRSSSLWHRSARSDALDPGFGLVGDATDQACDLIQRLHGCTIGEPHLARADPPDAVRIDGAVEQPQARVSSRLAAADDGVSGIVLRGRWQRTDRDERRVRVDAEARRVRRGDRGLLIAGVNHLAVHVDGPDLVGPPIAHLREPLVGAEELVLCQQPNAAGREQSLIEHPLEVLRDLRPRRLLVITGIVALGRDAILAEPQRVDTIEGRCGMQSHEAIAVPPVTTHTRPAVNDNDPGVRFVDQRVSERKPSRSRPDHQIVGGFGHGADPSAEDRSCTIGPSRATSTPPAATPVTGSVSRLRLVCGSPAVTARL